MSFEVTVTPSVYNVDVEINQTTPPFQVDVNVSSGIPYTGATDDVDLGDHQLKADAIEFDQTPVALDGVARLKWNPEAGTLDLGMGFDSVIQQVGMETFYPPVKNQTGSLIPNGTAVMAVGTLGASGRILIAPAIADGSVPSRFMLGITTHDIADGQDGVVTWFGLVRQFNTVALAPSGETWEDGDVLWIDPSVAGGLTNVEPSAPNIKVSIALIVHAATNGTIMVRPSLGMRLTDLHDVNAFSPSTNDLIGYNGTKWEAKSLSDLNLVTGSITSGQVAFGTGTNAIGGDSQLIYNNVDKRLEIGNTSTGGTILFKTNAGDRTIVLNGNDALFANSNLISGYASLGMSGVRGSVFGLSDTLGGGSSISICIGSTPRLTVRSNGPVGIATTSPTNTLDVNGTARVRTISDGDGYMLTKSATGVITSSSSLYQSGSNVLIGTTTQSDTTAKLEVSGRVSQVGLNGNTYIGFESGFSDTGAGVNRSVFIGYQAGKTLTTTRDNTFVGYQAGLNSTAGIGNSFFGYLSGSKTSANYNSFFGSHAGKELTTGTNNTCVGEQAGRDLATGNFNTLIGSQAGSGLSGNSISGNTFIGYRSGLNLSVTIGNNNNAIGYDSARYYSGGTTNATSFFNGIYLGTSTKVGGAGATNEIVIGYQAEGLGSNTTVIGNSSTTSTWLGGSLRVATISNGDGYMLTKSATGVITSSSSLYQSGSNVLIGTTTDGGYKLDVNGSIRSNNLIIGNIFGNGGVISAGAGFYGRYTGLASNISQFQDATQIGSNVTASYTSFDSGSLTTVSSTFTITNKIGLYIRPFNKSGTVTLTNEYGVWVTALNAGQNIYGIRSQVASGSNRWNLYLDGTASNYLGGNVLIGTTTDAGYKLDVNGTARVQTISDGDGYMLTKSATGVITSSSSLYQSGSNVLIGTTTDAGYKLDVNGTARVQGTLNVLHNNNNYTFGATIRNNSTSTTALTGINLNSNGTNVGQFVYTASNYIDTSIQNTVLFSSIGLQKLAFIANASNSGVSVGSDIFFKTRANNTNNAIIIFGNSQNVAINSNTEISSAQLQVDSTTKGFLPPRMTATQAEAIASPAEGLLVYSTDGSGTTINAKGWWGYDGTTWTQL